MTLLAVGEQIGNRNEGERQIKVTGVCCAGVQALW